MGWGKGEPGEARDEGGPAGQEANTKGGNGRGRIERGGARAEGSSTGALCTGFTLVIIIIIIIIIMIIALVS